ncbi:serine carboxypeptidase 3-like [Musa acuminata AAA Group]|uniref:serine carboxypeptidase 3-like n=1 Tax=Musa acuminata AAA Group TaxID=214697 RepID=UPI0031D6321B
MARHVHQGNNAKEGIHIKLKGFAIGNGQSNTLVMHWVRELLRNLTAKASALCSIQHMNLPSNFVERQRLCLAWRHVICDTIVSSITKQLEIIMTLGSNVKAACAMTSPRVPLSDI